MKYTFTGLILLTLILIATIVYKNKATIKNNSNTTRPSFKNKPVIKQNPKEEDTISLLKYPLSDSFDFPVGPPNAKGYYNAQGFDKNNHLGDDWNGKGGGNTDLGDPVFSIGNGIVIFSKDIKGGWGNIIRIQHNYGSKSKPKYIESIYAHLNIISVKKGDIIKRGQQVGTIGNAHGNYLAHLHFEIRNKLGMSIGQGYSINKTGYLNPTKFIRSHRKINPAE